MPGSVILTAAAAARAQAEQEAAAEAQAHRQDVLAHARTLLAGLLDGVNVNQLDSEVLDGDLVHVTDGTAHLAVRADDTVWVVEQTDGQWTAVAQVGSLVDVADYYGVT